MEAVFRDKKMQKVFKRKGFVTLPGLLNAEDVQNLYAVFKKYSSEYDAPFHTTHFSTNVNYKQEAHAAISEVVFSRVEKWMNNYKPLFGNFMVKLPNPKVSLDIHTDWTYVDESRYSSVAIWVPLVDVTIENGCFGVVEGSHKVTNTIRGPLIRESSRNFNALWANKYGELLTMKAGDAILYHHGLLHFSPPNTTEVVRPAINLTIVPVSAPCLHYCMPDGTTQIQQYSVEDTSFYMHYNHFQTPQTNTLVRQLPVSNVQYIDAKMKHYQYRKWLNRFLGLFD